MYLEKWHQDHGLERTPYICYRYRFINIETQGITLKDKKHVYLLSWKGAIMICIVELCFESSQRSKDYMGVVEQM